jgi:hypothetical protein
MSADGTRWCSGACGMSGCGCVLGRLKGTWRSRVDGCMLHVTLRLTVCVRCTLLLQVTELYSSSSWQHINEHLHEVLGRQCAELADGPGVLLLPGGLHAVCHKHMREACNVWQLLACASGVRQHLTTLLRTRQHSCEPSRRHVAPPESSVGVCAPSSCQPAALPQPVPGDGPGTGGHWGERRRVTDGCCCLFVLHSRLRTA